MDLKEIDPNKMIEHVSDENSSNAIEIKNSCFSWGLKIEEPKKKTAKEMK